MSPRGGDSTAQCPPGWGTPESEDGAGTGSRGRCEERRARAEVPVPSLLGTQDSTIRCDTSTSCVWAGRASGTALVSRDVKRAGSVGRRAPSPRHRLGAQRSAGQLPGHGPRDAPQPAVGKPPPRARGWEGPRGVSITGGSTDPAATSMFQLFYL